MGLFYNYYKPGKGVDKDETFKNIFDKYFKLLWRKKGSFIWLNLLYLIAALPVVALITFIAAPIIASINWQPDRISLYVFFLCLFAVWIGIAPVNIGVSYIYRQYAREAPAWMISDFFGKIKENFWSSVKMLLIDLVVITLMFVNFNIFSTMQYSSWLYSLSRIMTYVFLLLFVLIHFYLYQIVITFETNIRNAYKNALILAIAKLPQNMFLLVVTFVTGLIFVLYPWLAVLIGITPLGFAINVYVEKVISESIQANETNEE